MKHLPFLALGIVISVFVPQTWARVPAVASQTPEVSPQARGNGSPAPASVLLPEGTAVKLKLLHTLNSKTAVAGDPLNFTVAEDVLLSIE